MFMTIQQSLSKVVISVVKGCEVDGSIRECCVCKIKVKIFWFINKIINGIIIFMMEIWVEENWWRRKNYKVTSKEDSALCST